MLIPSLVECLEESACAEVGDKLVGVGTSIGSLTLVGEMGLDLRFSFSFIERTRRLFGRSVGSIRLIETSLMLGEDEEAEGNRDC